MPKIAHHTGPTAAGMDEIVVDGQGKLWQLDPERSVDGSLIGGDHPDRNEDGSVKDEGSDSKSVGDSSSTSSKSDEKSSSKSDETDQPPARMMANPSAKDQTGSGSAHTTGGAPGQSKTASKR